MSTDRPTQREQHQDHHHDCNDTSDRERCYSGDVARLNGHELVAIDEWGHRALKSKAVNADVGNAMTTFWNDVHIRLVIYASGYLAIWEPAEMKPELLGRFIHEEIIPVATFDDEDILIAQPVSGDDE